jgi:hypothetical protein
VSDRPNHTYQLRSLATQVASGIHVELASRGIHELLAEESTIEGEELDALNRVILGALT